MEISAHSRGLARDLLNFIDVSPSPWHAVQTTADRLLHAGFVALREDERWQLVAGGRYFVIRGGASIVASERRAANNAGGQSIPIEV